MARKRRSMKRRTRADWVYRGFEYDQDTGVALPTQVASFTGLDRNGGFYTLQVGAPVGVILYDSSDYMTQGTRIITGAQAGMIGREARPEGRRATVHAVEVDIFWQPTTWTAGTDFCVGARIVVCDQNMSTGGLDLPANYTLLGNATAGNIFDEPSLWANGWGNLKESILREAFATENDMARFRTRFRWRGKRTLQPHTCLGLYIESAGASIGSTSLRLGLRCRSLISDPNG